MSGKQLAKQGEFQSSNGIIRYTDQEPLWLAITKKCQDAQQLRKFIQDEGIDKLPELRGVAYWKRKGLRADFIRNVVLIFEKLADAERDEGLRQPSFHKAFFDAFMDNQDFYWMSPAHVKLAIQRGMNGHYNAEAKMYGNKLTIRHIMEWIYAFQNEWLTGANSDYDEQKLRELEAPENPTLIKFLKNE